MAQTRDYRSFSIITRGAVTSDVKNQLVLLEKDRTVAIILSQKNVIRPDAQTSRDVNHFFQIFDPLKCTRNTPHLIVSSDSFLDEKSEPIDPRLPVYFRDGLNITIENTDSLLDDHTMDPAHKVTVILLDRSRSMTDYRITSSDKLKTYSHTDMCKIMLYRLSDNILSAKEIQAIGLIEFAKSYKTICPITRRREIFEKALNFDECNGEWTCMYDSIQEAIRQIKTFTDSPLRARKDCKKLIICLSDGINNFGKTTIETLHELVKKHHVIIDSISFVRDDQLGKKSEVDIVRQMRHLCIKSNGYIYKDLHLLSDIELASIFEQEAAVWLSMRSRTSSGMIDKPERYIPSAFKEAAIRKSLSEGNINDSSNSRRICNEFRSMLKDASEDVLVFAVPDNIAFWKVILKGPADTPYEGKFWLLYVDFDSHYPKCAPNIRFNTPIYHVNISGDGKICHQILNQSWCRQTKMSTVFENILDLLKQPNFHNATSLEKAHLYKENSDEYKRQATAHSNTFAKNNLDSLKREYQLNDEY